MKRTAVMTAGAWGKYLKIAYEKARKESMDPSTQNAALLIDSNGTILVSDVNRFPDGVKTTPERVFQRPDKYKYFEHAERNVCYTAASMGIATRGLIMVCPFAACADCARAIIQCGIRTLVIHQEANDRASAFWKPEIDISFQMFREAGVTVIAHRGIIGVTGVLQNGDKYDV